MGKTTENGGSTPPSSTTLTTQRTRLWQVINPDGKRAADQWLLFFVDL